MNRRVSKKELKRRNRRRQEIKNRQKEYDEKILFRSAKKFIAQWPKTRPLLVILYDRESRQSHARNMIDRRSIFIKLLKKWCKQYGVRFRIVKIVNEVGNARSDFLEERGKLIKTIKFAKANDCVIIAPSVDRFVRPDMFSRSEQFVPLLIRDGKRFETMLDGVTVITAIPPGTDKRVARGILTKWGQRSKGKKGGRPKATMSLKERREKFRPLARKIRRRGVSYNNICVALAWRGGYIPRSTVVRWTKDIVPRKRDFQ